MKHDYLIVGQGLVGSILAFQLLKKGKSIAIVDERKALTSSRVAAGLMNPFTGPKMVKSWKAEELFPYSKKFYTALEFETRAHFFRKNIIYRPFNSVEALNDWDGRSAQPNYQQFIKQICAPETHAEWVHDPFGGIEIKGYVLNMPVFLDAMHGYLSSRCTYLESHFDESKLELSEDGIAYKGTHATKVVFCTGHQLQHSKFFGWLPLAPVKGEILYLKIDKAFETIYNKSCFIIPQQNGIYKAGSTYYKDYSLIGPSKKGKEEISKKLDALLKMNYEIVNHEAGIRPATVARRPFLGIHPTHKNLAVLNGMGSKGVSLAPFFASQLAIYLEGGNFVDQEVDIKKYYSLYFKSQFPIQN